MFVVGALWYLWLQDSDAELQAERAKEVRLRDDYSKKLAQAVNLEALKKQREQVLQYVTQMEKQLPSKAEMDALLSDINQAGIGRSLQFDLFRPGQVSVKEYYAELPIAIRVTGRYNDIGLFTSDIAYLSRIVTLNNLASHGHGQRQNLRPNARRRRPKGARNDRQPVHCGCVVGFDLGRLFRVR